MSLLMDALRKAEQAKRQAEATANRELSPQLELAPDAGLASAPDDPRAPLPELPDRLELLDDQFAAGASPGNTRRPPPAPPPKPSAESLEKEREAARQVFTAKDAPSASRLGFYLTLAGATLLAVLGIGTYFWWQLQPRSTLLVTTPPGSRNTAMAPASEPSPSPAPSTPPTPSTPISPPGGSAPTATVAEASSAVAAAVTARSTTPAAATKSQSPWDGTSDMAPLVVTAEGRVEAKGRRASARQSTAGSSTVFRPTRQAVVRAELADEPAAAAPAEPPLRVTRSRLQADPALERAYQHFQSGNLGAAARDYEQVLRRDPHNVDALNGLATIALGRGDTQGAEDYYERALTRDPRDPTAQAGLLGLRGTSDPVQAQSRLKGLIAAQPDAHGAQFALGNLYAAQGQWREAQQAYFQAYTGDAENPDYNFNLAVSLDQLRQPRPALQYYEAALAAAATRPAAFNAAQARSRAGELRQSLR